MRVARVRVSSWLSWLVVAVVSVLVGSGLSVPVAAAAAPPVRGVPRGEVLPAAERVREVPGRRTAFGSVFELADGRMQAEVSTVAVNYRDAAGRWSPIDTAVRPVAGSSEAGRAGFGVGNATNAFGSAFGTRTDRLARFELGSRQVTVGVPGAARAVTPVVSGDSVRFSGVFEGADVVYRVTPEALKEQIVLAGPPAAGVDPSWTFTVGLAGLRAVAQPDGSIALLRGEGGGSAVLRMPAPFMTDGADGFSSEVRQSLARRGSRLEVTVTADGEWLRDPARKYPVAIDPTVKIEPTPTTSQDVMVYSGGPNDNFNDTYRLDVGTTNAALTRSLVKFPLTNVPAGVQLDSAVLRMHYSKTHTSDAFAVPIEAHRVTGAWSAATATWNNTNGLVGLLGVNQVVVDDGDPGVTVSGSWPFFTGTSRVLGVGGDWMFDKDSVTPESVTWQPRLTESGFYRVEAHYVSNFDRPTAVPYTITRSGGTSSATLNQSSSTVAGVWGTLGTFPFAAGTTGRVQVKDVADATKAVVADAVRLTKFATATKGVNQWGLWHEFSVRDIAQEWLDGAAANNGIILKAADESVLRRGGPRYEGAEFAYNGETEVRPKLVLTWGRPSVDLAPVTVAHGTGGELSWSGYTDPSASPDDDIVEYQVHRSIFQTFAPDESTLVASLPTSARSFTDTTAPPTPVGSPEPFGQTFYYMVAVKTTDGEVIPSPTQIVRLPKEGQVFRVIEAAADTTLASGQPDAGHDLVDGHPDVGMGNLSGTFGKMRALVRFPALSQIPAGAQVVDAQVRLWSYYTDPQNRVSYEMRSLTRGFDEATATWNRASSGTFWTTPGGDAGPVLSTTGNFTNDPAWRSWEATSAAQSWISTPASNLGVMLKVANETSPLEESLALSSESAEPALRPQLLVTYTE